MPDHSIHRVSDLAGEHRPHAGPDGSTLESLRNDIVAQAREIGSRPDDMTDQELETPLGEAFSDARVRREWGSLSIPIFSFEPLPVHEGRLYASSISSSARFTGNLADAAHLVEPTIVTPITLSDPADDPVLYTAADGLADVLCTLNTRHFSTPSAKAFCKERGIRVMTDLDVLRELFGAGGSGDPDWRVVLSVPETVR